MNCSAKKLPITLEGDGCLIYNDIMEFMGTKRSNVTVNRQLVTNNVNDGATDVLKQNKGGLYLEAIVDVAVKLGDSTYSAIQSAI